MTDNPSRLQSWLAWRGLGASPPRQEGITCVYCDGIQLVKEPSPTKELYCICYLEEWEDELRQRYADLSTPVANTTMDDLLHQPYMKAQQATQLTRASIIAEHFILNAATWALFAGPVGTGKTHILRAIRTAWDPVAIYLSAKDLEDHVHRYRKVDELDLLYRLLWSAPILLLDDIGMEYGGPLVRSMIEKVVDRRYEQYKTLPMAVATNLSFDKLHDYIPRAADRLTDTNITQAVNMVGKSYRQRGQE